MAKSILANQTGTDILRDSIILKEVGFLTGAAVILSTGIIWYYNRVLLNEQIYEIYSQLELAGITFMPYLISGAIAALTALYLTHYVPAMQAKQQTKVLADRLQKLGEGDLVSFARIQSTNEEINQIAKELSFTVSQWNSQMSQMKIINRKQWDLLQEIKKSATKKDSDNVLFLLSKIEENWVKTAEIEDAIRT